MAWRRTVKAFAFGLAALLAAATLIAGPLDPPAGPVRSTFKTLREIEPRIEISAANTPGDNDASPSLYKITQPGSYYLTANITGAAGRHGIEVAASNVTIDLNGFELNGSVATSLSGIWCEPLAGRRNLTVMNGTVRNWGQAGVGVRDADGGRILHVTASNNAGIGIDAGSMFNLADCLAMSNGSTGIRAIGCTISDCRALQNPLHGIDADGGSTLTRCTAESNGQDGIHISSGSTVTDSTASENGGDGFYVNSWSRITNCVSTSNDSDGVYASAGSSVIDSHFERNGLNGSGAGIRVFGPQGRIEGNTCHDNELGIEVVSSGNIIIRNMCSGNDINWSIVANNIHGPIINRTSPASGTIIGDSGPDTLGSTHPNANFTY